MTGQAVPPKPFLLRLHELWRQWGISPKELLTWPADLVDGMRVCDVVTAKNKPIDLSG